MAVVAVPVVLLLASYGWLAHSTAGSDWLWGQLEATAGGAVSASHREGNLASGLIIHGFEYRSDDMDVFVHRIELEAGPGWWPLSLQIRSLVVQDVAIVSRASAQADAEGMEVSAVLEALGLPVAVELHDATLAHITFQAGDDPPSEIIEVLRTRGVLDERLEIGQLEVVAPGFQASGSGWVQLESPFSMGMEVDGRYEHGSNTGDLNLLLPFSLEASGKPGAIRFSVASPENGLVVGGLQLQLEASGVISESAINVEHAVLGGSEVDLGLSGEIDWRPEPAARFSVVLKQLDLSPWLPDWPAGEYLRGDIILNGSPSGLEIPSGSLTVAGTDAAVNITADIDIENNSIAVGLDWAGLGWPLRQTPAGFSSPSGSLHVSGTVDQWSGTGQAQVRLGNYPQGRFEIRGSGGRATAHLAILNGEVLGGVAGGEWNADWSAGLGWDAQIHLQGVDPEPLLAGWPGRLDADLKMGMQPAAEQFELELTSLQGELRGEPVSAHGGLSLVQDQLAFNRLEIRGEGAVLQLHGSMQDATGIAVLFNGRLPSAFLQGASGNLDLAGRYSVSTDQPLLELELQGTDLAWQGVLLDSLSLSLRPEGEFYQLTTNLAGKSVSMDAAMTLSMEAAGDPLASAWHGVIDRLELSAGEDYHFEMRQPAAMAWSPSAASVKSLCVEERRGAGLCLNADSHTKGGWSLSADLSSVSFDYLHDVVEMDVRFEQMLEGHMEWRQASGEKPAGSADFKITAGGIFDMNDGEMLAQSNEGGLSFTLQNGNLESGVVDMELPGIGFVDIDFDIADVSADGSGALTGRVLSSLQSIRLLGGLFLPGMDDVGGAFESDIRLSGSLSDPVFAGGFKLSDAFIHYAPIGLSLEDVQFSGQVEQHDRGSFSGQFRAGEGTGLIDGRFVFEDFETARMDIAFSGEQLLLVDTDALKVNAETDLTLGFGQDRVDINGRIRIPSARLTPENIMLGEVSDSEDLLIETAGLEASDEGASATSQRQFFGQLEVSFGDDVRVRVPGVESSVSGSVLFNWNGAPVPLAQGRYDLQGKMDVYGPTLQISNGHISFPGVPADNPLLNIRAQREIFGNTQIRAAGVQLIGTLKRPVIEAYTVPVTNEDRAWTLLVTGSDFDQGQGVGGFNVGTYIAPKLYVSYGISLFDDENVISARYDLKKGFGVKVTSGQRESGLDISYTIDR